MSPLCGSCFNHIKDILPCLLTDCNAFVIKWHLVVSVNLLLVLLAAIQPENTKPDHIFSKATWPVCLLAVWLTSLQWQWSQHWQADWVSGCLPGWQADSLTTVTERWPELSRFSGSREWVRLQQKPIHPWRLVGKNWLQQGKWNLGNLNLSPPNNSFNLLSCVYWSWQSRLPKPKCVGMSLLRIPHPENHLAGFDLFNLYLTQVLFLSATDQKTNLEAWPKRQWVADAWKGTVWRWKLVCLCVCVSVCLCVCVCVLKQFSAHNPACVAVGVYCRLPSGSVWDGFVCMHVSLFPTWMSCE